MFQEIRKNIKLIIIISIIVCIFGWCSSYAATTYAINSSNVEYKDNSSLGVTNVQAAIDGTCTKFNTQLTSLKADIVDTIYLVGSIYVSETDSTVTAVQNRFKTFGKTTTWVAYGSGKTLVGSGTGTDANGTTQTFSVSNNSKNLGEYTHTLTVNQLPSHTHVIPSLSGKTVATDYNQVLGHNGEFALTPGGAKNAVVLGTMASSTGAIMPLHLPALSLSTTSSNTTTCNNCSNTAFSVQNPYITVYMYKRTA